MQKFSAIKDPIAVHDYVIDWSQVMGMHSPSDTILNSSWTVDNGGVIDASSNTTTETTVWLSGGTLNEIVRLSNIIVTNGGRTYVRSIEVSIKDT